MNDEGILNTILRKIDKEESWADRLELIQMSLERHNDIEWEERKETMKKRAAIFKSLDKTLNKDDK